MDGLKKLTIILKDKAKSEDFKHLEALSRAPGWKNFLKIHLLIELIMKTSYFRRYYSMINENDTTKLF